MKVKVKPACSHKAIPTLKFFSEYFQCPRCQYTEARRVLGDVSHSPCPNCGNPTMYRV